VPVTGHADRQARGLGISGITAALHVRARSAVGRAVFGVLTGVSGLAALFLGVLLAG
jgi:hypothetical protein